MTIHIPQGLRFAGVHCGIKADPQKEDLSLIVGCDDLVAAGVYTQNLVYAPSVGLNRERTPADNIRAVVVNSGNANACTGQRGLEDTQEMARLAGAVCQVPGNQALVMSTGVIGEFLPMEKIAAGIQAAAENLGDSQSAFMAAARGFLTTDAFVKVASRRVPFANGTVNIAGMCKGAGMIGPNMATMLAAVCTDARLSTQMAHAALTQAVQETFNCISVEGHMSTSDTVLLLASGAGHVLAGEEFQSFQTALTDVCLELAKQIPADGEGASHLIEIEVRGCAEREHAHRIAKTVGESALVKTGIAGADPNWGRIISAVGYSGVPLDPSRISLYLNGTPVYQDGSPVPFDAPTLSRSIRDNRDTRVLIQLGEGSKSVRFWTSDLTVDYVRFNSEYHT